MPSRRLNRQRRSTVAITKDQLKDLITGLQDDDLRTMRAIINGKLGRRTISPEAQAKMQESRKKKEA